MSWLKALHTVSGVPAAHSQGQMAQARLAHDPPWPCPWVPHPRHTHPPGRLCAAAAAKPCTIALYADAAYACRTNGTP